MRKGYIVKGYVHDVDDGTMNTIIVGVYTTLDKAKREIRRAETLNNVKEQAVLDGKDPYEIYYRLYWDVIDII